MLLNISCSVLLDTIVMDRSKSLWCYVKSKLYFVLQGSLWINENYMKVRAHTYLLHGPPSFQKGLLGPLHQARQTT
jgi:hypothetical protein